MQQKPGRRHLDALDGLRGLAALVVVLRHCLGGLEVPPATLERILTSPLVVLLNAVGAVQLFFVLSGFVLTGSLLRQRESRELPQYFVRRVFRIHPPYAFAVLFAWTASFFYLSPQEGSGVGGWVRLLSRVHLGGEALAWSLLFPGDADLQLSVGWSLEVEMIFSFLMPFLLLLAVRTHWLLLVLVALLPLAYGETGHRVLKFAPDFAVGIALYLERERLAGWLGRLGRAPATGFVAASLLLFVAPWLLGWRPLPEGDPRSIAVTALGAAGLCAAAGFLPRVSAPLASRPCRFLGRVSYSLYLLHYPLILLLAPRLVSAPAGPLDYAVLLGGVLALGLPLSALSYRFVELPAIRAGNRVCGFVAERMHARQVGSRLAADARPSPEA